VTRVSPGDVAEYSIRPGTFSLLRCAPLYAPALDAGIGTRRLDLSASSLMAQQ
jgi:hypothetical protein